MSKITLSGNPSGSGNFTIAAPNSNSDRTLTLPDATGTVVTADGSGNIATTSITPSAGIYLGGSGSANLLDDYEEGLWTPTVRGAGTAGTYTVSLGGGLSTSARYTKIGNKVTLWAQFGFSAASGGTNYVQIRGLPFSYDVGYGAVGAVYTGSYDFSTANPATVSIVPAVAGTGDILTFVEVRDAASAVDAPVSGISTATTISFTISYTTAA